MTLNELITRLIKIQEECNYNAHPYGKDSDVKVWYIRDKYHDNEMFKIVDLDVQTAFGCGCWTGAEIIIDKIDDETQIQPTV